MADSPVSKPQSSKPLPRFAANITSGANCFDVGYLQTLDNDTASSILEFFVWQRVIPDYVVNAIFLTLPLANPMSFSLKKAILFRSLASDLVLRSVSEKTLNVLELIEELDRKNGRSPPSEAMKAAYCSVASSCTAAALRRNVDDFLDSFHRIWVLRICDIEKSAAAALISEEFREVRDIFWEAVKDPKLRPLVVSIDLEETLDLVRDYLEEVWDVEPLFSELAGNKIADIDVDLRGPVERRNHREGLLGLKNQSFCCAEHTELERLVLEVDVKAQNEIVEPIIASDSVPDGQLDQYKGLETSKSSSQLLNADGDEEALKASYLDLRRMLQNALDAKNNAIEMEAANPKEACTEELRVNDDPNRRDELGSTSKLGAKDTSIEGNGTNAVFNKYSKPSCTKEAEENQNGQDVHVMMASFKKVPGIRLTPDEENFNKRNSTLASLPKVSLLDRNPTAHTFEWTDSPPREGRFRLCSPKREPVSPLKLIDAKIYAKRRKMRKWTLLEEQTLLKAVREHGKGSWKVILSNYPKIFEERTEIDLKDKWRNMTKD